MGFKGFEDRRVIHLWKDRIWSVYQIYKNQFIIATFQLLDYDKVSRRAGEWLKHFRA